MRKCRMLFSLMVWIYLNYYYVRIMISLSLIIWIQYGKCVSSLTRLSPMIHCRWWNILGMVFSSILQTLILTVKYDSVSANFCRRCLNSFSHHYSQKIYYLASYKLLLHASLFLWGLFVLYWNKNWNMNHRTTFVPMRLTVWHNFHSFMNDFQYFLLMIDELCTECT